MIIQNFEELAVTDKKKDCLEILEAGLQAANPQNILPHYVTPNEIKINGKVIDISKYSNIYTVAFGKAGDSMTRAINSIISIKSGIIVIPKGSKAKIKGKKFQIFNSNHPKPDKTSVKAAKEVMKFVENKKNKEYIYVLYVLSLQLVCSLFFMPVLTLSPLLCFSCLHGASRLWTCV